jgi:hypothetical protein
VRVANVALSSPSPCIKMTKNTKNTKNKPENQPPKSGTLSIPQDLLNAFPAIPSKQPEPYETTLDTDEVVNGQTNAEPVAAENIEVAVSGPVVEPAPVSQIIGSTAKPLTLPKKDEKKGGRGKPIIVNPGEIHTIKLGEGSKAVEVPFTLPDECKEPTKVSVGTSDIGWIGREGNSLRAHFCCSDTGAVVLMPQSDGSWKANAFSAGRITQTVLSGVGKS